MNNRFMQQNGSECLLSVDCVDFLIQEPGPGPQDPVWFSHKYNGPALRYEIGICIQTGWICWVNGPKPAGFANDLTIFRLHLKQLLGMNEKVETDEGYRGDWKTRPPTDDGGNNHWKAMKNQAMARHETINGRIKAFKCMKEQFRHNRHSHFVHFMAVATIVQCEIIEGRSVFQIHYNIPRPFFAAVNHEGA